MPSHMAERDIFATTKHAAIDKPANLYAERRSIPALDFCGGPLCTACMSHQPCLHIYTQSTLQHIHEQYTPHTRHAIPKTIIIS